jgi:hypothetical protein
LNLIKQIIVSSSLALCLSAHAGVSCQESSTASTKTITLTGIEMAKIYNGLPRQAKGLERTGQDYSCTQANSVGSYKCWFTVNILDEKSGRFAPAGFNIKDTKGKSCEVLDYDSENASFIINNGMHVNLNSFGFVNDWGKTDHSSSVEPAKTAK